MNTRITLTAITLGMMTLAGCSSMSGEDKMMAKPAAEAAPVTTTVETVPIETGEAMVKDTMVKEVMTEEVMVKEVMTEEVMVKDTMAKEVMVEETMVKDDAMMKDEMSAGDAAFNECFAGGGQVVNFIGDPTGATMACEVDGVQTIL